MYMDGSSADVQYHVCINACITFDPQMPPEQRTRSCKAI